jgi:hypothetical protein
VADGAKAKASSTRSGTTSTIFGRQHQTRYKTAHTEASQILRVSPRRIEIDKIATTVQFSHDGILRSEKKICARSRHSTLSCSAPKVIQ